MTICVGERYSHYIQMESETTKRLNTWLPVDVFEALTSFAKINAGTAMDKWDYGVAFRILLMKAQYADMVFELEQRVNKLENNKSQSQQENTETKEFVKVKTWGDTTKLEDNKE